MSYIHVHLLFIGKIDKFLARLWVDLLMLWVKLGCKITRKNMGLTF